MSSLRAEQLIQIQIHALSQLTAYALFAAHSGRPDAAETIREVSESLIEHSDELHSQALGDKALAQEVRDAFAAQIRGTVRLAVELSKNYGSPKSGT